MGRLLISMVGFRCWYYWAELIDNALLVFDRGVLLEMVEDDVHCFDRTFPFQCFFQPDNFDIQFCHQVRVHVAEWKCLHELEVEARQIRCNLKS